MSVRSGRSSVTVSPTASPSSAAVSEMTIPSAAPTASPSASSVGATNDPGSTPTSVRSTGESSSRWALARRSPYGAASTTPGCSAIVSTWSTSITERVNAASVPVPSANAKSVTGVRLRPETPSLTSPAERPESRTTRIATSATTPPMRRKRVRAKPSSRSARNMDDLPRFTDSASVNIPTQRRYMQRAARTMLVRAALRLASDGRALRAVHRGHDGLERRRRDRRVDADAPQDVVADLALDVRRGGRVAALGQRVLRVVEHADVHAHLRDRVDERGDRAVARALERQLLAAVEHVDAQRVRALLAR